MAYGTLFVRTSFAVLFGLLLGTTTPRAATSPEPIDTTLEIVNPVFLYPTVDFLTPVSVPLSLGPDIVSPVPPGELLYPPAPQVNIPDVFTPWRPSDIALVPGVIDIGTLIEPVGPFDLLIIADEDFTDALEPLETHKEHTDITTRIYSWQYLVDRFDSQGRDDPERLKKAIASFKQGSGIKYVMLVGDSDRLPVRYCRTYDPNHWGHGYAPSDLYYADLYKADDTFDDWDGDGDGVFCEMNTGSWTANSTLSAINLDGVDLYPDVAVGRVPASTAAEVTTYVNKVIDYEFSAYRASWFEKAVLVVPGYVGDGDVYDDYPGSWEAKEDTAEHLAATGVTSTRLYDNRIRGMTDGLGDATPSSTTVAAALNDGVGFANFSGHGGPTIWGSALGLGDVSGLTNTGKLPVVFAAACSTARFHFETTWLDTSGDVFVQSCPGGQCWPADISAQARPEPAAVQRKADGTSYDLDSLAEEFLVKGENGAIGYIGAYTGTQGGSQYLDRYFFEGYRHSMKPPPLGYLWNYAVRRYIENDFHINFADTSDWYPPALFHHIQKYMLFGDPSLRVGGVSRVQRDDFAGSYEMIHDGWQGNLVLNKEDGDFIESIPNMGGSYTGSDNKAHAVWGYVRTATYPVPASWGPDHKIEFRVDFPDTPSTADDQKFDAYLFSWEPGTMAGITWWNGTPFGFYAGQNGVFRGGPDFTPGAVSIDDFLGTYAMNHDGWNGTLELREVTGPRLAGSANLTGTYTGSDGRSHAVRGFVRGPSQSMPTDWGPDHKIEFYVDFADTSPTTDDQKFEGYLFTQTKDGMAGLTWWNATPFGFYGEKRIPPTPMVLANGAGSIRVSAGVPVSVTVQADDGRLMEGSYDWWLAAYTPYGWFSFSYPAGYQPGIHAAFQAPLVSLATPIEVLNLPLTPGIYTFFFGFDDQPNGTFDGNYWLDWTTVEVQ